MTAVEGNPLKTELESAAGVKTDYAQLVLECCRGALRNDQLAPDDDFFAAGGHSLLAVQVMQDLGAAVGSELPVALIFVYPTPEALAEAIAVSTAGAG